MPRYGRKELIGKFTHEPRRKNLVGLHKEKAQISEGGALANKESRNSTRNRGKSNLKRE